MIRPISLGVTLLLLAACGGEPAGSATTTTREATSTTAAPITTVTAPPATTTTTTEAPPPPVPLDSVGDLTLERVGGAFTSPVFAAVRPGDDRVYVVEQSGVVRSMDRDGDDVQGALDISGRVWFAGERGLLGLAFHPDQPERLFVHYSRSRDFSTRVVEFHLPLDGSPSDGEAVGTVLTHDQPASNHNGGMIAFGPDGYLYIALGDGGGGGDTYRNGQDPFTLLGAVLRLDVGGAEGYAVPADNPFADGEDGAPEVWLWGLRNPWRFSFDGDTMWIADVGQGSWEEITVVGLDRGGANLGWPVLEGTHCFEGPESRCEDNDFIDPVHEYSHEGGRCSVTGGYVYRGSEYPDLDGVYFFGDYCSAEIMAIRVVDGEVVDSRVFATGLEHLRSFGVDHDGELYITAGDGVYRLAFEG